MAWREVWHPVDTYLIKRTTKDQTILVIGTIFNKRLSTLNFMQNLLFLKYC